MIISTNRIFYCLIFGLAILYSCNNDKNNTYVGYNLEYGIVQIISETINGYALQIVGQDSTYNLDDGEVIMEDDTLQFNRTLHYKIDQSLRLVDIKSENYNISKYLLVDKKDTVFFIHNIRFDSQSLSHSGSYTFFNIDDYLFINIWMSVFQITSKNGNRIQCQNIIDGSKLVLNKINPVVDNFPYEGLLNRCYPYPDETQTLIDIYDLLPDAKPIHKIEIESSRLKETTVDSKDTLYYKERLIEHLGNFNYILLDSIIHKKRISEDTLFLKNVVRGEERESCYIMIDR